MTTVETRVVDPVPKHSSVDVAQAEMDNAIESAEDKMMTDEEIDSCEGEDLEEHMINVAIMKSVVDSNASGGQDSPRYGLRKRPRPGDSAEGEVSEKAPKPGPTAFIKDGRLSLVPQGGGQVQQPAGGGAVKQQSIGEGSSGSKSIPASRQRAPQASHPPSISIKTESAAVPSVSSGAPPPNIRTTKTKPAASRVKKVSSPRQKGGRQVSSKAKSSKGNASARGAPAIVPSPRAVPNPLSLSTPPPGPCLTSNRAKSSTKQPSGAVPCPLPAAVPCPLPQESTETVSDSKVTFAELPAPTSRSRVFSVDLDRKYSI
mmetsp:Transcript_116289/g.335907  ORF Transcript_116289/g.335907 Transcript_116289/m.335907 type:complete len:316 (-) Transcript_116289:84-1031(-)